MRGIEIKRTKKETVIVIYNSVIPEHLVTLMIQRLKFEALVKKADFKKKPLLKLSKEIAGNWKKYYKSYLK